MDNFVEIDGSVLEGGGQILRMAISLSALIGRPVRVSNIRAGRAKPGLAAQHLKGLQLVENMCAGKLSGGHIGSTQIQFTPGRLRGGLYNADTQTAGSISLLLQVALPCALFADSDVILQLHGGTNADMAPQIDYMTEVFRPNLERFGASFDLDLHRRGYFPKGGGHVTVSVRPVARLRAVDIVQQGTLRRVQGWSFTAGTLPLKLAYEMSDAARKVIGSALRDVETDIECYKEDPHIAPHNCSGIVLTCRTSTGCVLGGSGLGARGVPAASAGSAAALQLCDIYNTGACVDNYTQDQLIIYMALAEGRSSVRVGEITLHTKTAIYIAQLLTECKFSVEASGATNLITCTGVGFTSRNLT